MSEKMKLSDFSKAIIDYLAINGDAEIVREFDLSDVGFELSDVQQYHVYQIIAKKPYDGSSFVAAENANEANEFIRRFKEQDHSKLSDAYSFVEDWNLVENMFSTKKGIVGYGIYKNA